MMNGYEIETGSLPERTEEDLLQAARAGEREASDLLVRRCFRLVKSCARPYFLAGADSDDLIQEGMLGLLKAVQEFDAARGIPFQQFARVCISHAIISAVRSSLASKHSVLNDAIPLEKPLFEDIAQSSPPAAIRKRWSLAWKRGKSCLLGSTGCCLISRARFYPCFWMVIPMKKWPQSWEDPSNPWIMPSSASGANRHSCYKAIPEQCSERK